jgi:hypothetical protein
MISKWWNGKDLEGSGNGLSLRYYPEIRLEELKKITKGLSQDNWSPSRDLNPRSPEFEARVLASGPQRSVTCHGNLTFLINVVNDNKNRRSFKNCARRGFLALGSSGKTILDRTEERSWTTVNYLEPGLLNLGPADVSLCGPLMLCHLVNVAVIIAVSSFSLMKNVKSRARTRLTNEHFQGSMRKATDIKPGILKQKQCQIYQ